MGYDYAAPSADVVSLNALRTNGARYWFAFFGLIGFFVWYVAPLVKTFTTPVSRVGRSYA